MTTPESDLTSRSRRVHDSLNHPVIDGDGHWLEPVLVFMDFLRDSGGPGIADEYWKHRNERFLRWYRMTPEQRQDKRQRRPTWWSFPGSTLDRATANMPALLYDRLDAFGIDFAIIYPSMGMTATTEPGTDLRRALCRAHNEMSAAMFAEFSDRMTPVAVIPSLTPEEAIEEARYVVNELHMKVALISGTIARPISAVGSAEGTGDRPLFIDNLVLDPLHDYDPLWQMFLDLKLAVTTHSGSQGWMDRRSPTNYSSNHIGHFAQANHNFARALFFAGTTFRFPTLNFAFMEGGVGWASNLASDLIAHWQTRSKESMLRHLRPNNLDPDELQRLFRTYGGKWLSGRVEEHMRNLDMTRPGLDLVALTDLDLEDGPQEVFDDFGAAHVDSSNDVLERFAKTFYFGCEADDPMTAVAFDPRFPAGLKPILGSDIGHFDVRDMTDVLAEAYELVDKGLIKEADFRAFTFENVVKLHGLMNSTFFEGTVVSDAAKTYLAQVR